MWWNNYILLNIHKSISVRTSRSVLSVAVIQQMGSLVACIGIKKQYFNYSQWWKEVLKILSKRFSKDTEIANPNPFFYHKKEWPYNANGLSLLTYILSLYDP